MFLFGRFSKLLPIGVPVTFAGKDAAGELAQAIAGLGVKKMLIVTDAILVELGVVGRIDKMLSDAGIATAIYDGVLPNPTMDQIRAGTQMLEAENCEAVLAVGGGSPMDAAKVIAAWGTNRKDPAKLAGMMKVRREPLPIFAVPTTAGTGSEVTIVAVVIDPKLVPLMVALDAEIMAGMPPQVTAATGMDALTHAIESFLSKSSSAATESYIRMAVPLIFGNLATAYKDGTNLEARSAMALASYYAGIAFTRTSVGYVHAIAHTFGAHYNTPHGLANAITLPHILNFSKDAAEKKLAKLGDMIGVAGSSDREKADNFRKAVDALAGELAIPAHLDDLRHEDIQAIAGQALAEGWANYPVPKYMEQDECEAILQAIAPSGN